MQPIYDLDIFKDTQKGENGRYNPSQKIFALMILEGDKKDRAGVDVPRYKHYSELLNIPIATLAHWYKDKDHIYKENVAITNSVIQATQTKIAMSIPSIYNSLLESLNGGKMKDSDKINFFREAINKMRLLSNRSTSNIEVNVNQFAPVPTENLVKPKNNSKTDYEIIDNTDEDKV